MPEITESTPRTAITISGDNFNVAQPFASGHILNANEASALNQTYAENVRNNMAGKIKALKEAGTYEQEVFQGTVDDYCAEYEFGQRTGGGRTSDPVMAEAMNITRDLVRSAISKAYSADNSKPKLSDISAAQISQLAKNQLSKTDDAKTQQIMAMARSRVESAKELTFEIETGEAVADETSEKKSRKAKPDAGAEA